MKFFIAELACETNTFSALPTGMSSFEQQGLYRGDGSRRAPDGVGAYLHCMRGLMEADGHDVVESLCAFAEPGGCVAGAVYETLRDRILEDLRAATPVDAVQLLLHGAMVAEGHEDCEGELLQAVRAFGAKALPAQAVLKALPPMFESKDAKARELTKLIVVRAGRRLAGLLRFDRPIHRPSDQ